MNTPENFLTRWSRRKHVATAENEEAKTPETLSAVASCEAVGPQGVAAAECSAGDGPALPRVPPNPVGPSFDPASVPPIEAIGANTDIRGFLAPGVPPELTRAALRRAWAADPKIRDFVGLADYDWDFNAPGSMAGFEALEMTDELRRLAAQIIGPSPLWDQTSGMFEQASVETVSGGMEQGPAGHEAHFGLAQNAAIGQPADSSERRDLVRCVGEDAALQVRPRVSEKSQLIVRRSHGGALPK
jgi:Protein of unknown function (DUF3306)